MVCGNVTVCLVLLVEDVSGLVYQLVIGMEG